MSQKREGKKRSKTRLDIIIMVMTLINVLEVYVHICMRESLEHRKNGKEEGETIDDWFREM